MKLNQFISFGLASALSITACDKDKPAHDTRSRVSSAVETPSATSKSTSAAAKKHEVTEYCPSDMVKVPGRFCIDRYEASMYDTKKGRRASPHYNPNYYHTKDRYKFYSESEEESDAGPPLQFDMPLPKPPTWQFGGYFEVRAESRKGQVPNAYISGTLAEKACKNAGKRLCTEDEWVTACKGEKNTKFPYDDEYKEGVCNISQLGHAALILHGKTVKYLDDPRLIQIPVKKPFIEKTGNRPECVSRWGKDGVYDMVGNLQEWIDDRAGTFLGGFSNLPSQKGCDERQPGHKRPYYDYSLGTRCCSDLSDKPVPATPKPTTDPEPEPVKPKVVCFPKNVTLPGLKVVPRENWAPLPANLEILGSMKNCNNYPIRKITLHHTGDGIPAKPGEGRARASGAMYFHLNSKQNKGLGWGDVAYHYLVTPNGEILEGRNPAFRADSNSAYYPGQDRSHTPEHHLVVALVGNYEKEKQEFTTEARSAISDLLRASMTYYKLSADDILTHKEVGYTGCPGKKVIEWFKTQGKSELTARPANAPHQLLPDSPYPQP